ncbi:MULTISPECIES: type II toxin-antitoxin system mRNA interferase toxin, RelE/StbE family [Microcystis]|jgi:addiction module RelE/StbE family toxin|uniref:Type II toxin-antitoxin system mRNA interferase toxin, RelE/StbE family n=3 Tax=Microcystis TaxID=1125 RepID=A0A841UP16_MICAE|nr:MULTISPECIES: type II toxin-antitoxin system mRNA interferase toxin, RelE/StbE family [Microcystis]MCA2926198.1 type II toxin-antitoxin system mRNA interferase toxin, RelE/StbE family [Microcystis sp. M020S1]MCA2937290.1 type II toxin-antitoxin system mRNA interferase toxin, RelE/StbE family [Microcystis sp. M015S1]MCU7243052.1 type II toxin-antitoxin system mRNA interferase toxin, RelE/StbE family [Microcystis aeruginosa WS75]NCS80044.1 type II toxin-antitoxin system mRNA interferase toxin,
MVYEVRFTKEAKKDVDKLTPKLKKKLKSIIQDTLSISPYSGKKLVGDLTGFYSIRLSYQDRILYTINDEQKLIYIHRTKTHYGE